MMRRGSVGMRGRWMIAIMGLSGVVIAGLVS